MENERRRVSPQLVAEMQAALNLPMTQASLIHLLYGQTLVANLDREGEPSLRSTADHKNPYTTNDSQFAGNAGISDNV